MIEICIIADIVRHIFPNKGRWKYFMVKLKTYLETSTSEVACLYDISFISGVNYRCKEIQILKEWSNEKWGGQNCHQLIGNSHAIYAQKNNKNQW
jgi:hypothetical protein